ncbi:hypothetical protein J6590_105849, partial [Homalodisca vitripennis]
RGGMCPDKSRTGKTDDRARLGAARLPDKTNKRVVFTAPNNASASVESSFNIIFQEHLTILYRNSGKFHQDWQTEVPVLPDQLVQRLSLQVCQGLPTIPDNFLSIWRRAGALPVVFQEPRSSFVTQNCNHSPYGRPTPCSTCISGGHVVSPEKLHFMQASENFNYDSTKKRRNNQTPRRTCSSDSYVSFEHEKKFPKYFRESCIKHYSALLEDEDSRQLLHDETSQSCVMKNGSVPSRQYTIPLRF